MIAQPLLAVPDVEASSRWYQQVLGAVSGHGGAEYEVLLVAGSPVLQLHQCATGHHHGVLAEPGVPLGNGVAVWFHTDALDAAVARSRAAGARVQTDLHVNPNAGHRELWLRDPDGYLVVLSGP
ncbi:VOC family protein [Labedaea rhizosphaerae]|uniref:Catechol 2,3-dioxygenase-like lactoylglutathione lyase family enzyme n=1 Tax=Labedaea rhizosphaerae TaxID=598644 RepID=A0A4R6S352_LABRH|nr:VOC family protein [Labedaea rhizosphaerae]TDP94099.1 catechol 2,3-dioxygenase-like lactoylglutathione lyase family enzyme [Labedaea rhizosphaerae]